MSRRLDLKMIAGTWQPITDPLYMSYDLQIDLQSRPTSSAAMLAISLAAFLLLWQFQLVSCSGVKQLKGHDFRVSATPITGYLAINKAPEGNYTFVGITKDYYDALFDARAGLKYHFVVVNFTLAAARGFVQASIDQLLNGEVDVSSLGYAPTAERYRYMDFTAPTAIEQYCLLLPYPKEESPLWGPVRPFQTIVWIIFIVSSCVFIIVLTLIQWLNDFRTEQSKSFEALLGDNAVYIISILISNAEYYRSSTFRLRILLAIWCLMSVIFINSYTGNLTSYLTIPALKPVPNSLEELATREDMSIIIEDKTVLAEYILGATSGQLKVLGDSLRRNPDHLFRTVPAGIKMLLSHKAAYPGMIYINYIMIAEDLKMFGKCGLTISKPIPYFLKSSAGLPKNGPFNDAINTRVLYITEMGLLIHLQKKYMPRIQKCLLEKREKPKMTRLNVEAFLSAFLILAFGFGLSFIILIAEILVGRKKSKIIAGLTRDGLVRSDFKQEGTAIPVEIMEVAI